VSAVTHEYDHGGKGEASDEGPHQDQDGFCPGVVSAGLVVPGASALASSSQATRRTAA
jgi:hypothetical protein